MEESKEILIENQDFVILGNKEYSFLKEKLLLDLATKKNEILSFFHLSSFPQVKVILFQYRDDYYDYLDTAKENETSISICCENISLQQFYLLLKRSIFHKYTEIVCASIYKEKISWLSVGLAEILSGERDKLEKSDTRFRAFYLDKIVRRDKKYLLKLFFKVRVSLFLIK